MLFCIFYIVDLSLFLSVETFFRHFRYHFWCIRNIFGSKTIFDSWTSIQAAWLDIILSSLTLFQVTHFYSKLHQAGSENDLTLIQIFYPKIINCSTVKFPLVHTKINFHFKILILKKLNQQLYLCISLQIAFTIHSRFLMGCMNFCEPMQPTSTQLKIGTHYSLSWRQQVLEPIYPLCKSVMMELREGLRRVSSSLVFKKNIVTKWHFYCSTCIYVSLILNLFFSHREPHFGNHYLTRRLMNKNRTSTQTNKQKHKNTNRQMITNRVKCLQDMQNIMSILSDYEAYNII